MSSTPVSFFNKVTHVELFSLFTNEIFWRVEAKWNEGFKVSAKWSGLGVIQNDRPYNFTNPKATIGNKTKVQR